MDLVDSAEKEASEVLHSLLSVERIEKHGEHQVVVVTSTGTELASGSMIRPEDQWHAPVFVSMVTQVDQHLPVDQVLWQGHTVQIDQSGNICQAIQDQYVSDELLVECEKTSNAEETGRDKSTVAKKKRKPSDLGISDPTVLEDNAQQVRQRFDKGCECQEENCFKGLSAEYVYRHRLNIAELTKAEHDMYLMGVTMAVLTNPEETVRRKERRRLRAQYVFQGRRVCLDAFLYLENCTHYQLKRIRKHVMTHGVAPRVHGNHGKKPHNTFPLDIYTRATDFLKSFIDQNSPQMSSPHLHAALIKHKSKVTQRNVPFYLPAEITRKTIHDSYKGYCHQCEPRLKVMGYSTFRHFMKEQFPNVKFCKMEGGTNGKSCMNGATDMDQTQKIQLHGALVQLEEATDHDQSIVTNNGEVQVTAIPVVLSHNPDVSMQAQEQTTYIVTPVTQLGDSQGFTQYQLTPAPNSYAVHQGTITMANAQGGTYAFTTL